MKHNDIGFLIKQISDRIRAQVDADLRSAELTYSQFHVLAYLAHRGGRASQKDIETFLGVSHPTVVGLIARLESKGFVDTAFDESDRRVKIISMTGKAQMLGESMSESHKRFNEKLMAGFSDKESAELIRLLGAVYSNLGEGDCCFTDLAKKEK